MFKQIVKILLTQPNTVALVYSSGSQPFEARGTLIWQKESGGTPICQRKTKMIKMTKFL